MKEKRIKNKWYFIGSFRAMISGILLMLFHLAFVATTAYTQGAGKALDFDGTDDYVEIPSSASNNFGTSDFSISVWINSALSNDGVIIEKVWDVRSTTGGNGWGVQLLSTGRFRFSIADTQGEALTTFNSIVGNAWNDGNWHNLVIVVDRDSNVNFYIDGRADRTGDVSSESGSLSNDYPLLIGINYNKGATKDFPFNGIIDEVRIWNVALTQAQIREMMCKKINSGNLPSGLSWSNLKGYWRFDESADSTCYDETANDNDGTMTNMNPATDRVYSGAPIGDESHYESGAGAAIETGDDLDMTVTLYGAGANTILYGTETNEEPVNNGTLPTGVVNLAPRYWDVKATNIDSAMIRFYWTGLPGINDESTLKLLKRDDGSDSSWTDITSSATMNTTDDYFQITETTFSQYVIAGSSDNPLPVELSSFTAQFVYNVPTLYWITQTETGNLGFNIYRGESEDAYANGNVIKINHSIIPGKGTSSEPTDYQFVDEHKVEPDTTYWYWLEDIDYSGQVHIHNPVSLTVPDRNRGNRGPTIPIKYGLYQNYPNPFNPYTEISFRLQNSCSGELSIYNIKGEKLITLFKGDILKDEVITVSWNGRNKSGREVSSGIYFYKLKTNKRDYLRKMIILK